MIRDENVRSAMVGLACELGHDSTTGSLSNRRLSTQSEAFDLWDIIVAAFPCLCAHPKRSI